MTFSTVSSSPNTGAMKHAAPAAVFDSSAFESFLQQSDNKIIDDYKENSNNPFGLDLDVAGLIDVTDLEEDEPTSAPASSVFIPYCYSRSVVGHYWELGSDYKWNLYLQEYVLQRYEQTFHSSLIVYNDQGRVHYVQPLDPFFQIDRLPEQYRIKTCFDEYMHRNHAVQEFFQQLFENGPVEQQQNVEQMPLLARVFSSIRTLFGGGTFTNQPELAKQVAESREFLNKSGYTVLEAFRWSVRNWQEFKKAPLFRHVTNLLAIAIATGFAPAEWSEFKVNTVVIFRAATDMSFDSVFSIADGVIEALNYFVEAVLASWEQGSLAPFLYERTFSRALDEQYEHIKHTIPDLIAGSYGRIGTEWFVLMHSISEAIDNYRVALKTAPEGFIRRLYSDRLSDLQGWQMRVIACHKAGELVKQPPVIIYHGKPGCGKSGLMLSTFKLKGALDDVEFAPAQVSAMNPDDTYDSGVNNTTRYLCFDDVANRPLAYDPSFGIAKVLQTSNNIRYVATKAAVDEKGVIMPDIAAVVGSTNNAGMHMQQLSVCPDSLRRRITRVDVFVKPEYANSMGGLDSYAFEENPKYTVIGGEEMEDFQTFTINRAVAGGYAAMRATCPETGERVTLENLSLSEYFMWLERIFTDHDKEQTEHIARQNKRSFKKCGVCGKVNCVCPPGPKRLDTIPEEGCCFGEEATEEHQSFLDDLQTTGTNLFMSMAFSRVESLLSTSDILSSVWSSGLRKNITEQASQYLFDFLNARDELQWWYWVPEVFWDSTACKTVAPLLLDVELCAQVKFARTVVTRLSQGAGIAFFGVCVVSPYFFFLLVPLFVGIIYFANLLRWYHTQAYTIFSKKRDALQQASTTARTRYSETIKILQAALTTLLFGYGAYHLWTKFMDNSEEIVSKASDTSTMSSVAVSPPQKEKKSPRKEEKPPPMVEYKLPPPPQAYLSEQTGLDEQYADSPQDDLSEMIGEEEQMLPFGFSRPKENNTYLGETEEDLKKKDVTPDAWISKVVDQKFGYANPTMSTDQLVSKARRNLSMACKIYTDPEKGEVWKPFTGIFWLCTNIGLTPAHNMPKTPEIWRLCDNFSEGGGKKVTVSSRDFIKIQGQDMAFVHLQYLDKANLIPYVTHLPPVIKATFVGISVKSGTVRKLPGLLGGFDTNPQGGRVITWKHTIETERGLCGGIYVSEGQNPAIIGVHYAGLESNLTFGRSFMPSQDDVREALTRYMERKTTILSVDPPLSWAPKINGKPAYRRKDDETVGAINDQVAWLQKNEPDTYPQPGELDFPADAISVYGMDTSDLKESANKPLAFDHDYVVIENAEQKQSIEFMSKFLANADSVYGIEETEQEQGMLYMGRRDVAAFYKSRVQPTIIAEDVQKLYNAKRFGPPRFGRSMYPKSAAYSSCTSPGFPQEHMEWAVKDYLTAFLRIPEYLKKFLRPLTWDETLNGINGVRFIDSLNFGTSMGVNFPGGKEAWSEWLASLSGEQKRAFQAEVWERVTEAAKEIAAGRRAPFIYSGTPKDEPTDTLKEKVRLFMVGEIVAILLVRKYFSPIFRILQMMPASSECAVGINATSPDWQAIVDHLDKFPHLFDGDFAKYDLRKAAGLSSASYRIMIEIAAMGAYTADDLAFMNNTVPDLIRPLVIYAQWVYLLFGSTPSGIPPTVIVNSIDNSLANRCAYFANNPNAVVGEFRRYVSLITYGDDFIAAVSYWRKRTYNFIIFQEYLAKYDMKLTPGIKDAIGKRFVDRPEDLVFLQRKTSKLPELSFAVGALAEPSIFKSLLSVLKSSLTPAEAAVTNVDGALREWVYHGREHYEMRRSQMNEILDNHGIKHLSRNIDKDYMTLLVELQGNRVRPPVKA